MIAFLITLHRSNILSTIRLNRVKQAEKNERDKMWGKREKRKCGFHCVRFFDPWFPLGVILSSSSELRKQERLLVSVFLLYSPETSLPNHCPARNLHCYFFKLLASIYTQSLSSNVCRGVYTSRLWIQNLQGELQHYVRRLRVKRSQSMPSKCLARCRSSKHLRYLGRMNACMQAPTCIKGNSDLPQLHFLAFLSHFICFPLFLWLHSSIQLIFSLINVLFKGNLSLVLNSTFFL